MSKILPGPMPKKQKKEPRKGRTRLRPMSKKREEDTVTYRLAVSEFWQKRESIDGYRQCQFKGKPYSDNDFGYSGHDDEGRCIAPATDIHHRMGRGKHLTNAVFFLGLCRTHHRYVEENKRDARARKYILY